MTENYSVFSEKHLLKASDFDCFGNLAPRIILELFASAAKNHAEKLGIGFEEMLAKNLLWVILKTKFDIIKNPAKDQIVTVQTWPKKPRRLDFEREYLILSESGEVLIKGSSQWAVIDSNTRRLAKADNVYYKIDEFYSKQNYEEKLLRVEDFIPFGKGKKIKMLRCHLDSNNHVNNAHYADFVLEAINSAEKMNIRQMQIDFHKELLEGDTVEVFYQKDENGILAKGVINDATMFSCRILF
ncbi:MAG: hypothetical protein IKB86_05620 [Clostridia bacterium]|nr:hypothetical protein [Clostridia bacterium]